MLTSRLVRNHPLPDGNKRVAFECLRTFLELNGYRWAPSAQREVVDVMIRLAAGEVDEAALATWLADRIAPEES